MPFLNTSTKSQYLKFSSFQAQLSNFRFPRLFQDRQNLLGLNSHKSILKFSSTQPIYLKIPIPFALMLLLYLMLFIPFRIFLKLAVHFLVVILRFIKIPLLRSLLFLIQVLKALFLIIFQLQH